MLTLEAQIFVDFLWQLQLPSFSLDGSISFLIIKLDAPFEQQLQRA